MISRLESLLWLHCSSYFGQKLNWSKDLEICVNCDCWAEVRTFSSHFQAFAVASMLYSFFLRIDVDLVWLRHWDTIIIITIIVVFWPYFIYFPSNRFSSKTINSTRNLYDECRSEETWRLEDWQSNWNGIILIIKEVFVIFEEGTICAMFESIERDLIELLFRSWMVFLVVWFMICWLCNLMSLQCVHLTFLYLSRFQVL